MIELEGYVLSVFEKKRKRKIKERDLRSEMSHFRIDKNMTRNILIELERMGKIRRSNGRVYKLE